MVVDERAARYILLVRCPLSKEEEFLVCQGRNETGQSLAQLLTNQRTHYMLVTAMLLKRPMQWPYPLFS